jgi:thioredoxin reductase (NADPH)
LKHDTKSPPEIEVAVVGGGPIGIETAIALKEAGVDTILFEAKQIGHAISKWPPNTHFYSPPERIALAGIPIQTRDQLSITGEEYLPYLRTLVEQFDLRLHNYEPVLDIERVEGGCLLHTRPRSGDRVYRCRFVVVATGGTAGPRKLGIPGEELPHVQHRFPGPHPYFRTRVLIVGGRNSAVESALRCWRAGAQVTISYRRSKFDLDVIKRHLSDDILTRIERGEIAFLPSTIPVEITPDYVVLAPTGDGTPNGPHTKHETDFVLPMLGFAADASLLANAGVTILGEEQMPFHDPKTMETNVPGIFVAGTAVGGTQWRLKHAIYTSHNHVARILQAITGQVPRRLGTVEPRNSDVSWEEVRAS